MTPTGPVAVPGMATKEIFNDFDIIDEPFVTRDGHPILAHILLPKNPPPGPRPVIVNWHGGYLIMAHGLYAPFFPQYVLDLARRHAAIVVSPDYTLLPHADGLAAVHDDMRAFHGWFTTALAPLLADRAPPEYPPPDLARVLLNGGSAGGYLATSHALAFPDAFRGLALAYPMIDFDTPWWRRGSRAVGAPNPGHAPDAAFAADPEHVRRRIERVRSGPRVSAAEEERQGFGAEVARAGFFPDVFNPNGKLDDDETVWLNRRIAKGAALPERVWVLHGDNDSAVPIDTSVAFAETMKEQGRPVRLDTVKGMDHGFDLAPGKDWEGPSDPRILEATAWLAEDWLRPRDLSISASETPPSNQAIEPARSNLTISSLSPAVTQSRTVQPSKRPWPISTSTSLKTPSLPSPAAHESGVRSAVLLASGRAPMASSTSTQSSTSSPRRLAAAVRRVDRHVPAVEQQPHGGGPAERRRPPERAAAAAVAGVGVYPVGGEEQRDGARETHAGGPGQRGAALGVPGVDLDAGGRQEQLHERELAVLGGEDQRAQVVDAVLAAVDVGAGVDGPLRRVGASVGHGPVEGGGAGSLDVAAVEEVVEEVVQAHTSPSQGAHVSLREPPRHQVKDLCGDVDEHVARAAIRWRRARLG
ncbi:alpha/beta hydrolase fold-3 domain-containingprotein [Purpureocillium lavendulum]|uniref:Alpha/beta hydrolase fold-3 domain-containingprotein n=1 Tax=Purpureocillium lavendulum TaxID=1247861 RepID=A0AB34FVS6_9HYPO|nr:alpha/beta hydrolase fold-3 domain-containingprotein [Purpureocillium lavendulum]